MYSASNGNKMRSCFLLILLFIADCKAKKSNSCKKDAKYICNPKTNVKNQSPEGAGRISKASNEILKVTISHNANIKKTKCSEKLISSSGVYEVKFEIEEGCPQPYIQTAYRTAKTTIRCDHKDMSKVRFFCKEKENFPCDDFLTETSSQKSEETFNLTETGSGFSLTISNVSSHHAGLYWCGVKEENEYHLSLTRVEVEPRITNFTKSPAIGQNLTYFCKNTKKSTKFICKGEDPSTCQHIVSTTKPDMSKRFSMRDDKGKKNITITVREVTAADSGTYWCGEESTDDQHSRTFLHRMTLNVVTTSATSPDRLGYSTTAPDERKVGDSWKTTFLIVGAVLLTLLLLVAIIPLYKRFSHSKDPRNRAAEQHPREDYVYEEIQENRQKSESGNALTSIYTTAKMPSHEPDSLHYATVNFTVNRSADGEALVKGSGPSCLYSTVRPNQSPAGSAINHSSRPADQPSIQRRPQQK